MGATPLPLKKNHAVSRDQPSSLLIAGPRRHAPFTVHPRRGTRRSPLKPRFVLYRRASYLLSSIVGIYQEGLPSQVIDSSETSGRGTPDSDAVRD